MFNVTVRLACRAGNKSPTFRQLASTRRGVSVKNWRAEKSRIILKNNESGNTHLSKIRLHNAGLIPSSI